MSKPLLQERHSKHCLIRPERNRGHAHPGAEAPRVPHAPSLPRPLISGFGIKVRPGSQDGITAWIWSQLKPKPPPWSQFRQICETTSRSRIIFIHGGASGHPSRLSPFLVSTGVLAFRRGFSVNPDEVNIDLPRIQPDDCSLTIWTERTLWSASRYYCGMGAFSKTNTKPGVRAIN